MLSYLYNLYFLFSHLLGNFSSEAIILTSMYVHVDEYKYVHYVQVCCGNLLPIFPRAILHLHKDYKSSLVFAQPTEICHLIFLALFVFCQYIRPALCPTDPTRAHLGGASFVALSNYCQYWSKVDAQGQR